MNSHQDSAYRLVLAQRYLSEAEQDLRLKRWRAAVEAAQLAVENAAKAIVACFGPVPRSHDLAERLGKVIETDLPQNVANQTSAIIPTVVAYGSELHVRASYGDEQTFRSPWELFGRDEARRGVEAGRQCLAAAKAVCILFFSHDS